MTVEANDVDSLQVLLSSHQSWHTWTDVEEYDDTLLHIAINTESCKFKTVKFLVDAQPEILCKRNKLGRTPFEQLFYSRVEYRAEAVRYFTRMLRQRGEGCRSNVSDDILFEGVADGDVDATIALLVDSGMNPNTRDGRTGWTAIHYAVQCSTENHYSGACAIVHALLESGAQPGKYP